MSKDFNNKKASSSLVEAFLNSKQEEQVVAAIVAAEKETSGEIRVHLENFDTSFIKEQSGVDLTPKEMVYQRAQQVFEILEMQNTMQRNGVLIYVAVNLRQFVVYGDYGINQKVSADFWSSTCNVISKYFKNKEFSKGLIMGISEIGTVLSTYFPYKEGEDIDELDNQISRLDG